MIIGLISIFSDLIGVIGSGTGILLSVSIIYGYYEKLVKDKKGNMKEEVFWLFVLCFYIFIIYGYINKKTIVLYEKIVNSITYIEIFYLLI